MSLSVVMRKEHAVYMCRHLPPLPPHRTRHARFVLDNNSHSTVDAFPVLELSRPQIVDWCYSVLGESGLICETAAFAVDLTDQFMPRGRPAAEAEEALSPRPPPVPAGGHAGAVHPCQDRREACAGVGALCGAEPGDFDRRCDCYDFHPCQDGSRGLNRVSILIPE